MRMHAAHAKSREPHLSVVELCRGVARLSGEADEAACLNDVGFDAGAILVACEEGGADLSGLARITTKLPIQQKYELT